MNDRVEELVLELSDPEMRTSGGKRRARAKAKLVYYPPETNNETKNTPLECKEPFIFNAPIGPIERDDISWYLERYHIWPAGPFKDRAKGIEENFPRWGKDIYNEVFERVSAQKVLNVWENSAGEKKRFTVFVDQRMVEGTKEKKKQEANQAASQLLSLPWELMNDGSGYLFQGAKPVQVRRQLPNTKKTEALVSKPPIRILLVSPRPEEEGVSYIDHRVSAIPLVEAVESLGGLVELTVLTPATFPDLKEELKNAKLKGTPYHVVHFDGHGGFSKYWGTGVLCFETHLDSKKTAARRKKMIPAKLMGELIKEYHISLFYLEACQSAMTEDDPTASVAAALLNEGAASVVAMSHSVLVETARRFVIAFYTELAGGGRIGDAMKAGHKELFMNKERGKIFGAGKLELHDWFVPVLYQEKEDIALFKGMPSLILKEESNAQRELSYGDLPPEPEQTFIGRSRELLMMERLLEQKKYLVICGQGGEGKTTIAAELGRWLVRTRRFQQVVFVCVEDIYDVRTVVDRIGRQLVEKYSVAQFPDSELMTGALAPIEEALRSKRTLIVLDNMESILQPWGMITGDLKGFDMQLEPEELRLFFALCETLNKVVDTKLIFTSRESIPSPFDGIGNHIELVRLDETDAIKLVTGVMAKVGIYPKEEVPGGTPPNVEALVEAVNCHARSLVLLAPYIGEMGVNEAKENIERLMIELDRKYPGERERSVFACVELSLRRLSPWVREAIKPLAVFHGGGHIENIGYVLELGEEKRNELVGELLQTRLVEQMPYYFLRFHPALSPYLRQEITEEERSYYTARWSENMLQMSNFLYQQRFQDTQISATLTHLGLPNLVYLLEYIRDKGHPEQTVGLATNLELLIGQLGRKNLLAQMVVIREMESEKIKEWGHIRFTSIVTTIERMMKSGHLQQALDEANALLEKCQKGGGNAYPDASYDMAMVFLLIGRLLSARGSKEAALQYINEAYCQFQALSDEGNRNASRMVSVSLTEKGNCFLFLGRLNESADAYQKGIEINETIKDFRSMAVVKAQLGTIRMLQGKLDDALNSHLEALKIFSDLGEPSSVATSWYQIGRVYEEAECWTDAEDACRKSLSICIQQHDLDGEASNLNQLGTLYDNMNRFEEAVVFYRLSIAKYIEIQDLAKEGSCRNNLADTLIKLERYDEARNEILRVIECDKPFGHAAQPWTAYQVLYNLERAVGNESDATKAWEKAFQLFLFYRRAGGENHISGGKVCTLVNRDLSEMRPEAIGKIIEEQTANFTGPGATQLFFSKLLLILSGSRDQSIVEDTNLYYTDAVELFLLLERLESEGKG